MSDAPKFVFILGTYRCGKKLVRSLLDGHPDLLVWPTEFPFFAYFDSGSQPEDLRVTELVCSHIDRLGAPESGQPSRSALDATSFKSTLRASTNPAMTSTEYLRALFEAFERNHRDFAQRRPSYYVLLCSGQGFDWSNDSLISESLFIVPERPARQSVESVRNKFLHLKGKQSGLMPDFFRRGHKRNLLYLITISRLVNTFTTDRLGARQRVHIPLAELQTRTRDATDRIRELLGIDAHSALDRLMRLGQPWQGNLGDRGKNDGTIHVSGSSYRYSLTGFEQELLDSVDFSRFETDSKPKRLRLIRLAWTTAFEEIPDEYASSSKVQRVRMFFRMVQLAWLVDNRLSTLQRQIFSDPIPLGLPADRYLTFLRAAYGVKWD